MDKQTQSVVDRLVKDFPFYSENVLRIRPKEGGQSIPFKLNKAQLYIHKQIEEQLKRTGKVRKLILKGRQQGCSTYVGGRYYHKTSTRMGVNTFIFAHDSEASASLYSMVTNYYDESERALQPTLGAKNYNEMNFSKLKSGYKVGTAGTVGLGRSKTFQLVHWSEVAYSPNAADHAAGILQTVPDNDDTEIILESTANGEGDFFHTACMQAMSGLGDFELIFVPWYWQDEYVRKAEEIELEEDEREYLSLFGPDGLTVEHLVWRRAKVAEFQGDVRRFKREYPFTPEEAFEASDEESYIKALDIRKARNTKQIDSNAPLIFGVDPARLGKDSFAVCHRKGRTITKLHRYPKQRLDEAAEMLAKEIQQYKPYKVYIDCGGLGVGVYDILVGKGFSNIVVKVDFGARTVSDKDRHYNKTAEMFDRFKAWLADDPCSIDCGDAEGAAIQAQISSRKYKWVNNSQLRMESKDEVKKDLRQSPDDGDAVLLTFAEEIAGYNIYTPAMQMNQPLVLNRNFNVFE